MIDNLQQGRTINDAYYAADLRCLRQEIARKRRKINSKCYSLAGQCALSHAASCNDCYD